MNNKDSTINAFLALLQAGLWENREDSRSSGFNFNGTVDWDEVFRLAEEQSVVGVVLAGIEHSNIKPYQDFLLQWIGEVQIIEQQNKEMNAFVADLIERLRKEDVCTILVKGQGIAQCYERPLWRCSGDVDLLLDKNNYQKAKKELVPCATYVGKEGIAGKHLGMTVEKWEVELHGTLHSELSFYIDRQIDRIQDTAFKEGRIRRWRNGDTDIFLPSPDEDVIFVFVHILQHFYKGGIGLRQICDWCRLLWTYRSELDLRLLESRIRKMGLMSEWKAFGAFAVEYLGMPAESMLFYSANGKWKRKANRICTFVMKVGNLGHNRDMSYYKNCPYLIQKITSLSRRCEDMLCHVKIFPVDSFRFFCCIMFNGIISMIRGK